MAKLNLPELSTTAKVVAGVAVAVVAAASVATAVIANDVRDHNKNGSTPE